MENTKTIKDLLDASQLSDGDYLPVSHPDVFNLITQKKGDTRKITAAELADYLIGGKIGERIDAEAGARAAAVGALNAGKADKVSGAGSGNFAGLDAGGNVTDSGKKAADFIPASAKGAANGVASLGADGLVPASQLQLGIGSFPNFAVGAVLMVLDKTPSMGSTFSIGDELLVFQDADCLGRLIIRQFFNDGNIAAGRWIYCGGSMKQFDQRVVALVRRVS
jgi:hypothetical protein